MPPNKSKDDETAQDAITPEFMKGMTGISDDELNAMNREAYNGAAEDIAQANAMSSQQLMNAEEAGSTEQNATRAESQEVDDLNYTGGDGGNEKRKRRGRLSRRQKGAGLGIVGLLVGGTFGVMTILQGPLQIVHFGQLLQRFHMTRNEDFGDTRVSKLLRNIRARNNPERKALGGIANKFADRFELRMQKEAGLRSVYDNKTGRHVGYEVVDEKKAKTALKDFENDGVPIKDGADPSYHAHGTPAGEKVKGKFIDLNDTKYSERRSTIRSIVKGTRESKIVGTLASRLLIKRAGVDFHPLKNLSKKAEDTFLKFYRERKKKVADEDSNGTKPPDAPDKTNGDDEDGKDKSPDESERDRSEEESRHGAQTGDLEEETGSNKNKLASISASAVGLLCAVHAISGQVENLKYANIILPLIRVGTRIVTTASQVMFGSNDVNLDELGAASLDLFKEGEGSWSSAKSIQAELGEPQTGLDIPAYARPSRVGDKGPIFGFVDTLFSAIGMVGDVACSAAGQFILGGLTGGWVDTIKSTVKGVAGGTAEEKLGVTDPSQLAAEWITKKLAGKEIDTSKVCCSVLGSFANFGARLASNDTAISMGGRKLTSAEVAELDAQSAENLRYDMSHESFAARVLNVWDVNSVAGTASLSLPNSPSQAFASILQSPFKVFSSFNIFSKKAGAASKASYDYGFDEYGFSVEEQNNPDFDDPFANADIVEPKLADLNESYGDCFSMTVDPDTGNLVTNEAARYDKIEENSKCSDSSEDLVRYRFYLADKVTEVTLGCNEGDEEACGELGFGGVTNTAAEDTSGVIAGDTYSTPCAPGSTDAGPADGYADGKRYSIRLCSVDGFSSTGTEDSTGLMRVNSVVSGKWVNLFTQAKAAGITLKASSSFRSNAEQTRLYNCYLTKSCNNGNKAARPGTSNHQMGFAVDVDITPGKDPSLVTCKANPSKYPVYQWLAANAPKQGIQAHVDDECWHWSVTGT